MDKNFLEFWGNFLINTAKEQQRMEDLSKWMQQGFKGFDELTAMFNKFYGLEQMERDTPAYMETWKKTSENFMQSFNKKDRITKRTGPRISGSHRKTE